MDDLKLVGVIGKQTDLLVKVVKIFTDNIIMGFGVNGDDKEKSFVTL